MIYFWAGLLLILAGGISQFFLPEKNKAACVSFFTGAGAAILVFKSAIALSGGAPEALLNSPGKPALFSMDPLSAFFVIVICVMGFIGTFYTAGYIRAYLGGKAGLSSHFFFLSLLLASMILTAVSQNAVVFLISWELMSLSSFFLVIFENEKKEVVDAGIYYLVLMHVSVIFLMAGFAAASIASGSFDFSSFKGPLTTDSGASNLVFILLFTGFAIKAGFIPLHTWLPSAHPAAPSHVSGLMSGVMIKLGIYGILRTVSFTHAPDAWISYSVLAVGAVSSLLGVLYAIAQHDMKRLLAYHSVENIGIIGMGIGLGMLGMSYNNQAMAFLGFAGAVLHVLNHSIFKELLFYCAGAVYAKTHTRDIESLGGLIAKMPRTSFYFLTGSIAISGIPPLNGFISEFLIFMAMLAGIKMKLAALTAAGTLAMAALGVTGAMALLCFTKIFSVVFLGTPRSIKAGVDYGEDPVMTAALALLAAMCALIGFFPQYALELAVKPAAGVMGLSGTAVPGYSYISAILSKMSVLFIVAAVACAVLFFARKYLMKNRTIKQETWGCGYTAPNSRMQYTASSYASPFLKFSGSFLKQEKALGRPEGLFPLKASFKSRAYDVFELYLYKPVTGAITWFLKLFSWIQSGSMQQYILYGLIFLVISIVWVIAWK